MSRKAVIISAAAIFAISLIVYGCGPHRYFKFMKASPEERAQIIVDRISDELDLNEAQKDTLNKIKGELVTKYKSKKGKFDQMFSTLQSEIRKDKMDENLLKQGMNEMHSDREEMITFAADKLVRFHDVLTPQQRETLANKMGEMKKKFHSNE